MTRLGTISRPGMSDGTGTRRRWVRQREELAAALGGLLVPLVALPVPAVQLFAESRWGGALTLTAMFGAVGVLIWMMLRPGPEAWRCPDCGYDRRGLSRDVCPECGEPST